MGYNVYTFKLITGEEIIAKSEKELDNWYESDIITIQSPLVLIQTQQGIGAMPWVGSGETDSVKLRSSQIIAIVESKEEVKSMFIKSTSGIDIATPDKSTLFM